MLGALGNEPDIPFTFDGRAVYAVASDSIASALLASGIRRFRSASNDHDPRGGFCFVGRCADCMVIVDGVPGTKACITAVAEGMRVETQIGLGPGSEQE